MVNDMSWSLKSGCLKSLLLEISCPLFFKQEVKLIPNTQTYLKVCLANNCVLGGGYQASGTLEALDSGAKVIIGGLFVQLICFGVFIVIAIAFDRSIRKSPTGLSNSEIPWKKHMMALYVGSMLIMVRSVFRAVEYLQGFDGYLLSHEVYLYIFDAVLMFLVMVLFNWIHPSEITALLNGRGITKGWRMNSVPEYHHCLGSDA